MRVSGPPGSETSLTLSLGGCSTYRMNLKLISSSEKKKKPHEFFFKFSSYSKSRLLLTDDTAPICHTVSISRSILQSPRDPEVVILENGPQFLFLLQRPTCYQLLCGASRK